MEKNHYDFLFILTHCLLVGHPVNIWLFIFDSLVIESLKTISITTKMRRNSTWESILGISKQIQTLKQIVSGVRSGPNRFVYSNRLCLRANVLDTQNLTVSNTFSNSLCHWIVYLSELTFTLLLPSPKLLSWTVKQGINSTVGLIGL